ncbi:MAG: bifunctional 3-phenylpropionate/cinnamic acid dioxygenase ferredoxin subunit [Pseudomonadota bacterium]|nr:bifunctional 3-phenylpropionate/cinnamic acid dioxygenase ferredoxin subunit [Pseudomonadota bacterium]
MFTPDTDPDWTRVCATADLPPGEATILSVEPPVAIFHAEGSFYAIDDTCTHETYSLADGYIQGTHVECPLHFAKFDLKTGAVLCLPAKVGVRTYPVKTESDQVFVDLSSRG